jgi:DNA-binding CsgD family transcriptional regulator
VQTIWRHQMNIFHKVGVENQLELVRVATEWQMRRHTSHAVEM